MEEPCHIPAAVFRRMLRPSEVSRLQQKKEPTHLIKQAVRHLVQGCPQCAELGCRVLLEIRRADPAGEFTGDFEPAFQRASADGLAEEPRKAVDRLIGWGQWAALEPLPPDEREALVVADKSHHRLGFYHALRDAGRWYSRRDPHEAVEILALAVRVAELLDPAMAGGLEAACDLQAEGWALLGNFSRLTADFEGARKAISKAWELHAQGTGDTVKQAFILALEASYICDLGEHEAAEAVLGQAMRIYRTRGELWLQGRTLIKMGDSIGKVDPEKGISHLRHGLQLIEASREPRLELCAQHDLACFLNELGKTEEAIDLLNRTRPLYKQFDDDWTQLRLRWLEGRIARSLKHLPEAIHVFRHLWESFRKRDLHYELVLVSLDLAEAQAANGDHEETATLTAQVHSIVVKWPWLRGALHNRWYGELWKRLGTPPCGS